MGAAETVKRPDEPAQGEKIMLEYMFNRPVNLNELPSPLLLFSHILLPTLHAPGYLIKKEARTSSLGNHLEHKSRNNR